MTLDEAIQEFEFDCKIRHLSPKTIDNYRKQLRYFERFLGNEFSILLTLPALKVKETVRKSKKITRKYASSYSFRSTCSGN